MAREVVVKISAQDSFSTVFANYNRAVGEASDKNATLATKSGDSKTAIDDLSNSLRTGIAAYAGWKGIQLVGDIINLGNEANIAEQVFSELTDDIGGLNTNLDALRSATGYAVDDLTLMQGSSKMLSMGLVSNTSELSEMMAMAIQLGGAMGMDVNKSITDFSLLLANNSILRLDQLGISGAAVRERMAELKDEIAGLSKEERFKIAVMEEGRAALDRLGTSAESAQTPVARFGAAINNWAQDFSQRVATGFNALLGIVEIATGNNPMQLDAKNAARLAGQEAAGEFSNIFIEELNRRGAALPPDEIDFAQNLVSRAFEVKSLMPGASLDEIYAEVFKDIPIAGGFRDTYEDSLTFLFEQSAIAAQQRSAAALYERRQQIAEMASESWAVSAIPTLSQGLEAERNARKAEADAMAYNEAKAYWDRYTSYWRDQEKTQKALRRSGAQAEFEDFMSSYADLPAIQNFADAYDVNAYTSALSAAESELERIQELADTGLITDVQLERATSMVDHIRDMKDEANAAYEAFQNLTIAQATGTAGGGMAGEMTDSVMERLKEAGMSESDMTAVQRVLDLASGRQTEASLAMSEQVIPQIANLIRSSGADAGASAMANVQAFLQQATLANVPMDQMAAMLPGMTGFVGDYQIQGFNPLASLMQMGLAEADPEQITGGMWGSEAITSKIGKGKKEDPFTAMKDNYSEAANSAEVMAENTTTAKDMADELVAAIEQIPLLKEMKIRFTADDPMGIIGMINRLMGGGLSIADATQANGGAAPGTGNAGKHRPGGGR